MINTRLEDLKTARLLTINRLQDIQQTIERFKVLDIQDDLLMTSILRAEASLQLLLSRLDILIGGT